MNGRGMGPLLLAGLLAALVSCQAPTLRPPAGRSSPQASPAASTRLAAADSALFKGDYDAAESAYLQLIKEQAPGAASHYSTLLAYEARLPEAVTEAQAGVDLHRDSDSLGRLARALDWSEDVAGAVAAGASAVSTTPVSTLSRLFYAEALSDSGRFTEAESQLRAASSRVTGAYERAELDREWSNLYRDRGVQQSELNYIELAIKDQPGFPERQLELARYYYANQKPASAQALLQKLASGSGAKNYRLLVAGAAAAFTGGDPSRAGSLLMAAAQVRPSGTEAALGRAELAVAVNRDFQGAHDILASVLRADPQAADVSRYLRYLDLLVLKRDPAADAAQSPDDSTAQLRKAALESVNRYRSSVGVAPLTEDPGITQGAEAHAYSSLFNLGQPQLQGLGIHSEDQSLPGFSGESSIVRDRHFGYTGTRGAEVINHVATAGGSVRLWIDSVYHRYPLLARETTAAGYAMVSIGIVSLSVLDLGLGDPVAGDPLVYPTPEQENVPAYFNGGEVPDPLPPGTDYPVGYPVTLQLGAAQALSVSAGRLLDASGAEVPSYQLQPGSSGLSGSEWALLAKQPLKPGGRYTVEVAGKADGQDFDKRWSFTVATQ